FARRRLAAAGNNFSVDRERNSTVTTFNSIMVPLTRGPGSIFIWQTAHPATRMRAIRYERCPVNREHIAMSGPHPLGICGVEDLHLDRPGEGLARSRQSIAPNEDTGVAAGPDMFPFQFENEVFVLTGRAKNARGNAGAVDHSLANAPRIGSAV